MKALLSQIDEVCGFSGFKSDSNCIVSCCASHIAYVGNIMMVNHMLPHEQIQLFFTRHDTIQCESDFRL